MRNDEIAAAFRESLLLQELNERIRANEWYSRALSSRSSRVRSMFCIMGDRSTERADKLRDQLENIIIVRPSRN